MATGNSIRVDSPTVWLTVAVLQTILSCHYVHCFSAASGDGSTLRCSDADEEIANCHGGSCVVMVVDGQRKPSCRCRDDYYGSHCELTDVRGHAVHGLTSHLYACTKDEQLKTACLNNGTCFAKYIKGWATFCMCVNMWGGPRCETKLPPQPVWTDTASLASLGRLLCIPVIAAFVIIAILCWKVAERRSTAPRNDSEQQQRQQQQQQQQQS